MEKVYEGKLSKALGYATLGYPHLCLTIISEDEVEGEMTPGFDTDYLFDMLKDLAQYNEAFRKKLVDYVIDLSKIC